MEKERSGPHPHACERGPMHVAPERAAIFHVGVLKSCKEPAKGQESPSEDGVEADGSREPRPTAAGSRGRGRGGREQQGAEADGSREPRPTAVGSRGREQQGAEADGSRESRPRTWWSRPRAAGSQGRWQQGAEAEGNRGSRPRESGLGDEDGVLGVEADDVMVAEFETGSKELASAEGEPNLGAASGSASVEGESDSGAADGSRGRGQ